MRALKTILLYTIKERLLKKSFIISTFLMCLLVMVMFNVPKMVASFEESANKDVLVVDSQDIFVGTLGLLNTMDLGYNFIIKNEPMSDEEIGAKINNDEYISAIVFYNEDSNIRFDYIMPYMGSGLQPEIVQNIFTQIYYGIEIAKLDLSLEQLSKFTTQITYEVKTPEGEETPTISAPLIILSIALFFAIYYCAFQVSATITMEKTSKVMETLVTSSKPRAIILGKTIGTGLVGLIQLVVIAAVALASYKLFAEGQATMNFLDFSQIKPAVIVAAFAYFILGYTLYAFLYALVGSTVSKPEDIQSANAPVAMISLFGFYFGYFTMLFSPASDAGRWASILPFSSPFSMPFRMMMIQVPTWEIIASLVAMFITILIIIHVSIKIYSAAVLHYGSRIGFKDLLKLYKNK